MGGQLAQDLDLGNDLPERQEVFVGREPYVLDGDSVSGAPAAAFEDLTEGAFPQSSGDLVTHLQYFLVALDRLLECVTVFRHGPRLWRK